MQSKKILAVGLVACTAALLPVSSQAADRQQDREMVTGILKAVLGRQRGGQHPANAPTQTPADSEHARAVIVSGTGADGELSSSGSPLGQVHGRIFYMCSSVVRVDLKEKMDVARNLVITGQDYGQAKAILDLVIGQDGRLSEAYILRALCLTEMEKFSEAEKDYREALVLEDGTNPTFFYLRALNYMHSYDADRKRNGYNPNYGGQWGGDLDQARKQMEKALELAPYYLDAQVGMGDVYALHAEANANRSSARYDYAAKDYDKALEWYNKVLAISPGHDIVLAKKADAMRGKDAALAAETQKKHDEEVRRRVG